MVDSRAKGARGEYLVRDMLREFTGLKFERVPASGALEYLKGDLYVPNQRNHFSTAYRKHIRECLYFPLHISRTIPQRHCSSQIK